MKTRVQKFILKIQMKKFHSLFPIPHSLLTMNMHKGANECITKGVVLIFL